MAQARIAPRLLATALLAISLGLGAVGCLGGPHPLPPELTPSEPTEGSKGDAGAGDSAGPPGGGHAGPAAAGASSGPIGNGAGRGGGGSGGGKSDSGADCGAGIRENDAGTPCNPDEDSGTVAR